MHNVGTNLDFWRQMRALRSTLVSEPEERQRFDADPIKFLKEKYLDFPIQRNIDGSATTLSAVLESLGPTELKAVAQSLMEVHDIETSHSYDPTQPNSASPEILVPVNILALVNVLIGVNVGGVVNAGALANIDIAVNVLTAVNVAAHGLDDPLHSGHDTVMQVTLPEGHDAGELSVLFSKKHLNNARQKVLYKRVLLDPDSLISRQLIDGQELRISEYTYQGIRFRIEAALQGSTLLVRHSQVLAVA